jgi:hypothetical protein
LTIKATNKFSIVTLLNYDKYQFSTNENGQQNGQQAASKRPASGHKQELKNSKNVKEEERSIFLIESFFKEHGRPSPLAQKFYNYYDAKSWRDTKCNPISNWKAVAQQWFKTNPVEDPPPARRSIQQALAEELKGTRLQSKQSI